MNFFFFILFMSKKLELLVMLNGTNYRQFNMNMLYILTGFSSGIRLAFIINLDFDLYDFT